MDINIKYLDKDLANTGLQQIDKGNWIDVRACRVERNGEAVEWSVNKDISYLQGDVIKIYLGYALELPVGYEALLSPRSSTFKNYGVIQTNSVGVIDNSFCGDGDEWAIMFYALKDGDISKLDRVAQFRIIESMPILTFNEVDTLGNKDRGAYGSTGVK